MQLGEIDALAVEAETPAERRHQEADHDDPPAIIADGGFVGGCGFRTIQCCPFACDIVMAGHSRPKDGVASARLCPAIHVLLIFGAVKTWMPGTSPGMTTPIIRSVPAKLRYQSKCQPCRSGFRPGRIVEETLAEDLVAAPLLQRDLVDAAHPAGLVGQFENPVNGDVIAFNHR